MISSIATATFLLLTGTVGVFDNAVVIEGSAAADQIEVRQIGNQLSVILNGVDQGRFPLSDEVRVRGLGGDDEITFQAGITANAIVDGGSGDDTIRTGAGDDFIVGGLGNDTIFSLSLIHI